MESIVLNVCLYLIAFGYQIYYDQIIVFIHIMWKKFGKKDAYVSLQICAFIPVRKIIQRFKFFEWAR